MHALNDFLAHHDAIEDPVSLYAGASRALFLLLIGVLLLAPAAGSSAVAWRRGAVAAGCSAVAALAIANVLAHLVDRARPFVSDPSGIHVFSQHAADPGFPSDHATASFAIAVAILLRSRRWGLLALAMAGVLAAARVALGLHYPSDVLAGAALGAATAIALWTPRVRRPIERVADGLGGLLRHAGPT